MRTKKTTPTIIEPRLKKGIARIIKPSEGSSDISVVNRTFLATKNKPRKIKMITQKNNEEEDVEKTRFDEPCHYSYKV